MKAPEAAEVAYTGLIKYHAEELASSDLFRRTGRLTPTHVHKIAQDLAKLDSPHPLDETIERVLARFDQLELERERDADFRERARLARADLARHAELRAGVR